MTCAPSHIEKNPVGRPQKHDREQIAIDIVEWAKKDDSINICKFCATYNPPIPPSMITRFKNESIEFRQAYETARAFLGFRREEWLNQEHLHVKAYDLNATTYDYFLKEEKQEQQKYESMLKKEEVVAASETDRKAMSEMTQLFSEIQASSIERNKAEIKSNAETRS